MIKIFFFWGAIILFNNSITQTTPPLLTTNSPQLDSGQVRFKFKDVPWYIRTMPFAIYTGAGKTRDRVAQYVELGKSFDVLDLGVAFGRNSLRPDTTLFAEAKITMNVANFGIFTNEMTIGSVFILTIPTHTS